MTNGPRFRLLLLLPWVVVACGCSSLVTDRELRAAQLASYVQQPERHLFFYPTRLRLDAQLSAFGMASQAAPLVEQFHATRETRGIIERFIALTPSLARGNSRIVEPHEWKTLAMPAETPVLFFHVTWTMSYQRFPPNFQSHRMQTGVIAKLIPLGQVLSGNGSIALHTAAWEGKCLYEPYEGRYFANERWLADDGALIREAIAATQRHCAEQLAREFSPARGTPEGSKP